MDLFCPAIVLVARHAEAEYVETCFSDEGGCLATDGRAQALGLARAVEQHRIARVWCSDASRAVQTAEIAAHHLGVGVTARKALREIFIGDLYGEPFDVARIRAVTDAWADGHLDAAFPGGESGHDVIARYRGELQTIADLHRGESVLVIGHESAMCAALPGLADNLHPPYADRFRRLDNGETVELGIDADGLDVRRWGRGGPGVKRASTGAFVTGEH